MVDFKKMLVGKRALAIKEFIARKEADNKAKKIEPFFVPYNSIKKEFGEGVDAFLESLVALGEIERHETLNSCSYSIKK